MSRFDLAKKVTPGADRVWVIKHQPQNQSKPVRLELREFVVDRTPSTPVSMSRLIGFTNTIADEKTLVGDAQELIARVGRVDQFIGIYG